MPLAADSAWARWQTRPGLVRHGFTHFVLELGPAQRARGGEGGCRGWWHICDEPFRLAWIRLWHQAAVRTGSANGRFGLAKRTLAGSVAALRG